MNFDDMDDEEKMRELERMFMRDADGTGVKGVHLDMVDDIELFEKLMKELILPHLELGGVPGAIQNVKVMRVNGDKKKADDFKWLDKWI